MLCMRKYRVLSDTAYAVSVIYKKEVNQYENNEHLPEMRQ